jgi:alanine racemase
LATSKTPTFCFSIDSRSLQNSDNTLFFAIVGPNNDAHIYVNELINKGVHNFVVQYIPDGLCGHNF